MKNKTLIVLDLDETLVHFQKTKHRNLKQLIYQNKYIVLRPYLNSFIEFIQTHFHIAVWTSATQKYADFIVKSIFTTQLTFLYTRKNCTLISDQSNRVSHFVKDTIHIKPYQEYFDEILIIDDKPELIIGEFARLIPILKFDGNISDNELNRLVDELIPSTR